MRDVLISYDFYMLCRWIAIFNFPQSPADCAYQRISFKAFLSLEKIQNEILTLHIWNLVLVLQLLTIDPAWTIRSNLGGRWGQLVNHYPRDGSQARTTVISRKTSPPLSNPSGPNDIPSRGGALNQYQFLAILGSKSLVSLLRFIEHICQVIFHFVYLSALALLLQPSRRV